MKSYLESKQKCDCTGCGACALICPKKCIKMKEDKEGFLYPSINNKECIKCNKCINICINKIENNYQEETYAVYNKNNDERKNSTSGGIFPLLAKEIIKNDGCVYGACYDENMQVIHKKARTLEECEKFKGSKYVRSNFEGIYKSIQKDLTEGKQVLFTGTPCESDGLRKFLNKEYENLLICDIICHSNPSPKMFKKYISYLEKRYNSKVININFRDKTKSWHKPNIVVSFENGKKVKDEMFYDLFSTGVISRLSCYNCKYTSMKRNSDMTIGDFWGIEKIKPQIDDDKGISVVIIHSKKGKKAFINIQKEVKFYKVATEDSIKYNHNSPIKKPKKRDEIFENIDEEKKLIYMMKKYFLLYKLKVSVSNIIPIKIKNIIKAIVKNMKGK